jgi:hypothetical protein
MHMSLTGNETLEVIGVDGLGRPSGAAQQTTTAAIAALAGGGLPTGGLAGQILISDGAGGAAWSNPTLTTFGPSTEMRMPSGSGVLIIAASDGSTSIIWGADGNLTFAPANNLLFDGQAGVTRVVDVTTDGNLTFGGGILT